MTPIFARGRWNWYDPIVIALAAGIVYPDKVCDWLSTRYDRTFGFLMFVLVEIFFIGLLVLFVDFLQGINVNVSGWYPVGAVAIVAFVRMISSFINDIFGINKW